MLRVWLLTVSVCAQRSGQNLITRAAGKARLSVSHRLCQTQAPCAKTEQISTRTGPAATPRSPGPRNRRDPGRAGWPGKATNSLYAVLGPRRGRGGPAGAEGRLQVGLAGLSKGRDRWERKRRRRKGGCGAGSGAQQRRSRGLVGAAPASPGQRKARGRGRRGAPGRRRAPLGFHSEARPGREGGEGERPDACRCCPRSYSYSVSPLTPPRTPPSGALPRPAPATTRPGGPTGSGGGPRTRPFPLPLKQERRRLLRSPHPTPPNRLATRAARGLRFPPSPGSQ